MARDTLERHARQARENVIVRLRVASSARVSGNSAAVGPPRYGRGMNVHIVALGRRFAGRMTVHASGIHNDLGGFTEQSPRARLRIRNIGEA